MIYSKQYMPPRYNKILRAHFDICQYDCYVVNSSEDQNPPCFYWPAEVLTKYNIRISFNELNNYLETFFLFFDCNEDYNLLLS